MDFLKEIIGSELFSKLEAALTAHNSNPDNQNNQIKLCNLAAGEYVSKGKCIKLENEKAKTEKALADTTALIEQLKATAPPDEAEYQRRVSDLEQQIKQVKIDTAVKIAFMNAGVTDTDYLNFKLREAGELKLDDSGNVIGLDSMISRLKTANPGSFPLSNGSGNYEGIRPKADYEERHLSRNELLRMPYSELLKFYNENPDGYREIMNT